jgi:hypothetical protein
MRYVMRWSAGSAVVLLTVVVAVFGAAGADGAGVVGASVLPSAMAGRLDGLVLSPSVSIVAQLNGVFCTSSRNCWAVGFQLNPAGNATLNQMLRWDGTTWEPFPVPEPGGIAKGDYNELLSVRCLNARDCWSVGYIVKGLAAVDQLLHWNGTKWSHFSAPSPGGTGSDDMNELNDVTCVSSADCWAVGFFTSARKQFTANQVLRWNGRKWSLVTTPDPAGTSVGEINMLSGIRCSSASACLADGQYGVFDGASNEVLRWNGKKWRRETTPNPGGASTGDFSELTSLACSSPSSCWAAGWDGKLDLDPSVNEMLHWNGRKWFTTKVPDPATGAGAVNVLIRDTCVSARDCWAVGTHGHNTMSSFVDRNDTLHWNGTKWSHVHSPNPGSTSIPSDSTNALAGIRCTSATNCWAVGVEPSGDTLIDEILYWNGQKWSSYTFPWVKWAKRQTR